MRLDDPLHVVLNGLQGTICSGTHFRKLSFFSRANKYKYTQDFFSELGVCPYKAYPGDLTVTQQA